MTATPRLSLARCRKILRPYESVSELHDEAHEWVRDVFVPALRRLEKSKRSRDRILCSGAYYVLGDLHDFNDAPLAAIRCYRKSFRLDPWQAAALREIGLMYQRLGRIKEAVRILRRSLRLNPSDKCAQDDLRRCLDKDLSRPPFLYEEGDKIWRAAECMAQGRMMAALKIAGKRRSMELRLLRARAWGGLGETHRVLDEWKAIVASGEPLRLDWADWYYLPDAVHDSAEFWECLWRVRKKLIPGTFSYSKRVKAKGLSSQKLIEANIRYQIRICR